MAKGSSPREAGEEQRFMLAHASERQRKSSSGEIAAIA